MSLLIGKYEFEGPLVNRKGIKEEPGIYAVLSFSNQDYELVEMGESGNLQSSLVDQEKLEYWQSKSIGMLTFSVHYSPRLQQTKRKEVVFEILKEFDGNYQEFEPTNAQTVASGSL